MLASLLKINLHTNVMIHEIFKGKKISKEGGEIKIQKENG